MPELPEVETVKRGLAPYIEGARIAGVVLNRPDLRFPFPDRFAEILKDRTIVGVGRRAKYLVAELDSGVSLLSHLGMTGTFRFEDQPTVGADSRYHFAGGGTKHDHVVFYLALPDGTSTALVYADPRRFGFMTLFTDPLECAYLSHLGPEPLGNDFSAPQMGARFRGRRTPIKSALLDQRNVAGLGNIYVSEALWRAGIAPTEPAGHLSDLRLEGLVAAVRDVLNEAIAAGGSTLKDFRAADGASGYFQHRFDVYDREGAACRRPGCGGTIARIVQSGRASYFCPRCQAESG